MPFGAQSKDLGGFSGEVMTVIQVLCPRCQSEMDPALSVCSHCGSRQYGSRHEAPWREQIRETVRRRKEMRRRQLAKREDDGRQLSIFPEATGSEEGGDAAVEEVTRRRRAEIRARVEEKMTRPSRHGKQLVMDAGEVSIPVDATTRTAELESDIDRLTPIEELAFIDHRAGESRDSQDAAEDVEPAELATGGERVLAGLIDTGFVSLTVLALLYVTTHLAGRSLFLLPSSALAALGCVAFFLSLGYFLFFWSLSGQTLGKLMTGSRVVASSGRPLGFPRSFVRLLGVLLALLPLGAGLLGLWSDRERRGWHDRLASTRVVRG